LARLLEASLCMRPDRIILGELRGEENRTCPETIYTGRGGAFTTIHAAAACKAIDWLAIIVLAAGLGIGFEIAKRYCEGSVDLVVQLAWHDGCTG
jgi:type IV secretion system protein VirB11